MPWTISDVDRFKRGLTPSQKRQWVAIANSVLSSCLSKGGNQQNCEVSAIRQANGTVGNNIENIVQINRNYTIRSETLDGKRHIVVPVVMMVEGVHNGSQGPLLHLAEELGRFPGAWNGIPVTIQHPQDGDMFVSANSPNIINSQVVGRVFNTRFEDGKLKGEAWLGADRLLDVSPVALGYINQGRPLDVSVGVFTDEDYEEGEWNGEQYTAIARNHRPDHLALLPGGTGACSWNDGCGIRTNSKKGGNNVEKDKLLGIKILEENKDTLKILKQFHNEGYVIQEITCNVEKGFKELVQNAQMKLDRMDDDTKIHFLQEIYNNHMVYEVRRREQGGSELYKRNYSVNDDESIEFTSDPVKVHRNVEYVTMRRRTKFYDNNKQKEIKTMSKEKDDCPLCEKIDQLIANELINFTEEDREFLSTLEENQLDKMIPKEKKEPKKEPVVQTETKVSKDDAIKVLKESMNKPEEFIKLLPSEVQEQINAGLSTHRAQRASMVKDILANSEEGVWVEDELKAMEFNVLAKLHRSVVKPQEVGDYAGMSISHKKEEIQANEEDYLLPPGVAIKKEKTG